MMWLTLDKLVRGMIVTLTCWRYMQLPIRIEVARETVRIRLVEGTYTVTFRAFGYEVQVRVIEMTDHDRQVPFEKRMKREIVTVPTSYTDVWDDESIAMAQWQAGRE